MSSKDEHTPQNSWLELREFQLAVLEALTKRFPDESFKADADPMVIHIGEEQGMGLRNIHRMATHYGLNRDELAELAIDSFERLRRDPLDDESIESWDDARPLVRLQIMPREYVTHAEPSAAPVSFPLNQDALVGIVIDQENGYVYVRRDDLERWQISAEAAYEQAVTNLEKATEGISLQSTEGPDRCVGIEVADGYDAARILLPDMRRFLIQHLGSPFFVGIPNRDLLICWAQDCSAEFQTMIREKLERDFQSAPYPVTPAVLVADAESVKPE